MATKILRARLAAKVQQSEVSHAIGISVCTFDLMELGKIELDPEQERIVLTAISRLKRFRRAINQAREKLTADLKLPASRSDAGTLHSAGNSAP